jgi:hypothetical protein
VSALAEIFDDVVEADVTFVVKGDNVKVRAPDVLPPDLVARLRAVKVDITALHHEHLERLHHYARRYEHETASRMAYNVVLSDWHLQCGQVPARTTCAGCGKPLNDWQQKMVLQDGAHLHDSDESLAAYGETWRTAASEALQRFVRVRFGAASGRQTRRAPLPRGA